MRTSPEIQEIVIVSGASRGIGEATARKLARQGFHVLAGVRRNEDADAIRGPGIEPIILDTTKSDHIQALAFLKGSYQVGLGDGPGTRIDSRKSLDLVQILVKKRDETPTGKNHLTLPNSLLSPE